ncbi:MAG: hypothetical protein NZ839_05410, partial [Endomicrobia bacterium]|nr:hypothetical protein [Endomicrobiia bacterium]
IFFCCTYSQLTLSYESDEFTQDLELLQKQTAVSEKIQGQIQNLLNNYFDKNTFVVNVKVNLERLKTKETTKQQETEELVLPGLPFPLKEEVDRGYLDKVIAESLIFTDKFKIKNIEIILLLDQEKITSDDEDFIKTLIDNSAIVNKLRGDEVIIKRIKFPPPLNVKSIVEKEEKFPEWIKEIYPYIYYGSIILLSLIFLIILLQIINLIKAKHEREMRRLETTFPLTGSTGVPERTLPSAQRLQTLTQTEQLPSLPTSSSSTQVQERKDLFYELRQLMVT